MTVPEYRLPTRDRQLVMRWWALYNDFVGKLLAKRPTTLLGYLVGVASIGILFAVVVIMGVALHILHRLF